MSNDHQPVDGAARIDELARQVERLTADLARANAELGRVVHLVSHDLKEPLRAISGFAKLLDDRHADALDASGRTYLGFIVDGAERMGVMLESLLELGRTARHEVTIDTIDLADVVRDVLADLRARGRPADAVTAAALPTVRSDAVLVRLLTRHLIDNALLYVAPAHQPVVAVTGERRQKGWSLTVRDQGLGIAPEDQARVFDLFTRLHSREDYPGTGIGLGLVAMAAQRLDGTVDLESAPDAGTTVTVQFPGAAT